MNGQSVPNRDLIQQQINDLQKKATQRPGEQDDMGMVGFMSALLAAKMQAILLQAGEQNVEERGDKDEQ